MGYLLPWGQMSFWGAQVIINLFGTVPVVGPDLVEWIRGDFTLSLATLNRFFALHVVAVPLALVAMVFLHIVALHKVGSNNPDGVEIKDKKDENGIPLDGIPFHPYYSERYCGRGCVPDDLLRCGLLAPDFGGYFLERPNFEPANSLKTPDHIAPVWYFTPFYTMLRAVPHPFLGFMVMALAIVILFLLPWLDRQKVKSIRYRGASYKILLALLVISFIILGVLGVVPVTDFTKWLGRICTVYYFFFFIALWFLPKFEKTKPVPERVTDK